MTREPSVSYSPFSRAARATPTGCHVASFAAPTVAHPITLSTYAKKVTVSVLYSYEKLSGVTNRESLGLAPQGANFFLPGAHWLATLRRHATFDVYCIAHVRAFASWLPCASSTGAVREKRCCARGAVLRAVAGAVPVSVRAARRAMHGRNARCILGTAILVCAFITFFF